MIGVNFWTAKVAAINRGCLWGLKFSANIWKNAANVLWGMLGDNRKVEKDFCELLLQVCWSVKNIKV